MPIPLSILDLAPLSSDSTSGQSLRNSIDLAKLADRLVYTRFWLAEHHNIPSIAISTPEIMIGLVAHEASRIRVGSGGVMLPNHAPLKVVEAFRTLGALFPGRIDLGIGRAPGTDQLTAYALRRSQERLRIDDFPDQLAELMAFDSGAFPENHPFRAIQPVPRDAPLPPLWGCLAPPVATAPDWLQQPTLALPLPTTSTPAWEHYRKDCRSTENTLRHRPN
ncbi:MAG: MsnO8 family LLM class oxidoreductase [Caldilineaceae bacterium]